MRCMVSTKGRVLLLAEGEEGFDLIGQFPSVFYANVMAVMKLQELW